MRQPTPAPTLAEPSHDEQEFQTDGDQTSTESPGTSRIPELSSMEQPDDKVHVASSPLGSSQSAADVDIGARAMHWPLLMLT